jgi:hypothetical protein
MNETTHANATAHTALGWRNGLATGLFDGVALAVGGVAGTGPLRGGRAHENLLVISFGRMLNGGASARARGLS